jgi:hypothetical protein
MKLYTCDNCQNLLYFENNICLNCKHTIGFDTSSLSLISLLPSSNNEFLAFLDKKKKYRICKNAEYGTCNWLVEAGNPSPWCTACAFNRVIPTLNSEENLKRWSNIEIAKHRLIYSLLRLRLPLLVKKENEEEGLAFDFMADVSPEERVMTGHDKGTITLNIEEGDEAARTRHKLDLGEKYRTLLGHFRHEIGHYYWDVLIRDSSSLKKYRELFGNEQKDYGEALKAYYENGVPASWSENFISPYATAHPWEDWAETWAHYLHMMDTLETAYSFGIRIRSGELGDDPAIKASIVRDPYDIPDFDRIMKLWLPLSFAVNSLNRSMGHADFYPFIISPGVSRKLEFIHELCFINSRNSSATI